VGHRGFVVFASAMFAGAWAYGVAACRSSRVRRARYWTAGSESRCVTLTSDTATIGEAKRSGQSTNRPATDYERPEVADHEVV
jgi:hypothetical protein